MTKKKRYKRYSPEFKREALIRASEEGVPTMGDLKPNHWALTVTGNGFDFDTVTKGKGPNRSYTIEDTAGCSCEQIIEIQGLGDGHSKHGCSISAMDDWIDFVNP